MVVVALPGAGFDAATERLVGEDSGGVVLLARSIVSAEQVRTLLTQVRDAAPLPPIVAVDEEGGRVARFGRAGLAPDLPAARDLAATRTPEEVRALGKDLGAALASYGVTMDLAPVLDVTAAADDTVIGDRSYSNDPAMVGAYATAFADGLRAGGLLTTGKHWPGHGRTDVDSHVAGPVVDVPVADLMAFDAVPYHQAAPALDVVMVSHLRVPALDAELPASLSPAAIALLREQVGWRGAVATDDLAMRAITDTYSQPEAAERALAAGQDLLLTSDATAATAIVDRLADAVASGRVPQTRLHDALRRTLPLRGVADADVTCLLGLPPPAAGGRRDRRRRRGLRRRGRAAPTRSPTPRRWPTSTSNPAATPRARWTPCRSVSRSRRPAASRSRPWPALRTTPPRSRSRARASCPMPARHAWWSPQRPATPTPSRARPS